MYCKNCGAELNEQVNFCPYCGGAQQKTTTSFSLMNKAVSTAQSSNRYNLVLVSRGNCNAVMAGDLLEDVFGYTDAESANLVNMAPVVVGENLTAEEAATVAQMFTEYGMQVSVTDREDKYVDLTGNATSSIFDNSGNLLAGAAAIIGALTVANRITSYRRYKKPSLLERLFHLRYDPAPPAYHRNFRPRLNTEPLTPRRTIRKPDPSHKAPANRPHQNTPGNGRPSGGEHSGHGGPSGRGRRH